MNITIQDTGSVNWDAVSMMLPSDDDSGYMQGVIAGAKLEPLTLVHFEEDGITDYIYVMPDGNVAFTMRADCMVTHTDKPPRDINKFLKELYELLKGK